MSQQLLQLTLRWSLSGGIVSVMLSDTYNHSLSLWEVKDYIAAIAAVPETPTYVRDRAQVLISF